MYDGFAIVVLYAALVVAAAGSVATGALSMQRGWIAPKPGVQRFAKPWLWMTAFAALSLFNGKWEPMAFFGALAAGASLLYWIGTVVGNRR